MAYDSPITITVDGAQSRLQKDWNTVLAQGSYDGVNGGRAIGWDLSRASATAVDPATFTAFLGPYQQSEDWHKTFSGNYARKRKTDFAFGDTTKWKEVGLKDTADYWLLGSDLPANETIITTATFGANRGFYIAFENFNLGDEEYQIAQCGWNTTATISGGLGLKIFSSGRVEVYRGGVFVAAKNLSGLNTGAQTSQQWVSMLLIPGRHHELMVIPNQGQGFTVEFEDLADDTDPAITAASSKFWMMFPASGSGRSIQVQICPVTYPTTGYICAQKSYFAVPPESGDTLLTPDVFYNTAGAGTTSVAASLREATSIATTFSPDGVKTTAYVRFDLTGDGNYSPFIYGGVLGYASELADTDDSESADITNATTARILRIGETADSDEMALHALGAGTLGDAGMIDALGHSGRPLDLVAGGKKLFDGITMPPIIHATAADEEGYDIEIPVQSRWKALEEYQFRQPYPLDGVTFVNAIKFLLRRGGYKSTEMDIEDPGITLENIAGASSGEFSLLIEVGDTAAKWIERIFESYAGNWFYGEVPSGTGRKFIAKSPTGLGTTVSVILWPTVEEARAQLVSEGLTTDEAVKFADHRVYTYRESRLQPEANEVRVTGRNPRTGQPIQSFYIDSAAADPTTAPSSRPVNWTGLRSIYALSDPIIASQASCERAVDLLKDRLTVQRRLVEFSCPQLVRLSPTGDFLWKPMRVTLKRIFDGVDADVRVSGLECEFDCDDAYPYMNRPARYFGEVVSGETPWRGSVRASNIDDAKILHDERLRSKLPSLAIGAIKTRGATVITTP